MHLSMLLEMASEGFGSRVLFGPRSGGLTCAELLDRAQRAATWIDGRSVDNVVLVDTNSDAVPVLLYGSGLARKPFVPVNYRLADDRLRSVLQQAAPAVAVVEDAVPARVGDIPGISFVTRSRFLAELEDVDELGPVTPVDPEDIAILLFTSGTTGEPKAAVLRHRHLSSYVISTVEFMGADVGEAALVSVPPYHVAGTSAVLTATFAGRRTVYLSAFTAEDWVTTVRDEAVTQAMVVPTMLDRILDVLERDDERLPHLRHLSYGGGRMPVATIERALQLLPHVDFVNAYGLTETSSTISVLGPQDHRDAAASADPAVRHRLGSVGRPLATLEIDLRDGDGRSVPAGEAGEIWVRGDQVAGEYLGRPDVCEDGWFPTRDAGILDVDGFLYLTGRLDDVIVRGGENLSPGEIEDVLRAHPAVVDVGVVGVADREWGETVAAAVVLRDGAEADAGELQDWVRTRLRSGRTPTLISFRAELPYTETGKLLRRVLKDELNAEVAIPSP